MSSGKTPPEGKHLPINLAKQGNFPILGRLGEEVLFHMLVNDLFLLNLVSQ